MKFIQSVHFKSEYTDLAKFSVLRKLMVDTK